jgi:hypothetical protein
MLARAGTEATRTPATAGTEASLTLLISYPDFIYFRSHGFGANLLEFITHRPSFPILFKRKIQRCKVLLT